MTPYELLNLHLQRHVYKRGANKGDAPLEKRSKSHVRIWRVDANTLAVRMYETDILTVRSDGTFTIALDSWETSTTKSWLNYAFRVARIDMTIGTKSVMSLNQLTIRTPDGWYVYYNGMDFDANCRPTSGAKPFYARRINKTEVAEFMLGVEQSGFKAMFPVLYGAARTDDQAFGLRDRNLDIKLTDPDYASDWSAIIANRKFEKQWEWTGSANHTFKLVEVGTAKSCWAGLMREAKAGMYDNVETEVTVIPVSKE